VTLLVVLGVVAGISTIAALVMFVRIMRRPTIGAQPEEDTATVPSNVVDAAFAQLDRAQDGGGVIFGLPPKYQPKADPVPLNTGGQVEVPGHPCDYLSGVLPPRFRPGECQGICWHRDRAQRGRVCFWVSQSAANCPWYQPRVRLTRVKLKKIEGGKKSA